VHFSCAKETQACTVFKNERFENVVATDSMDAFTQCYCQTALNMFLACQQYKKYGIGAGSEEHYDNLEFPFSRKTHSW